MERIDNIMIGIDFKDYWDKLPEDKAGDLYNKLQCWDEYLEIVNDWEYEEFIVLGKVLFRIYEGDEGDQIIDLNLVQSTIIKVKEEIKKQFGIDCEPTLRIVSELG